MKEACVEATADPDARMDKKALADKAIPSYQGHALIENHGECYGLTVAGRISSTSTHWVG